MAFPFEIETGVSISKGGKSPGNEVVFSSEEKHFKTGSVVALFHKIPTPIAIIQFISNYAYYQYFLQVLTPALTFNLKLLVGFTMSNARRFYSSVGEP